MRYSTPKLGVESDLMGARHEFTFDGYEIKVILPTKDQADRTDGRDEVARANAWKIDAPKDPFEFAILQVDVEVNIKEKVIVPEGATDSMKVYIRTFDSDPINKEKISNIAKKYAEISNKAFQYWLDLLRWSKNYPFFGKQKPSQPNSSGWGIYLQDMKTGNSVFNLHDPIFISLTPVVTVAQWKLIQERLAKSIELPMHIKFKFDAQESMRIGNYERAIIELALACEIYVRRSYSDYLPKKQLHGEVIKHIEKASISHYLKHFFSQIIV
ncbi:MAG: hypothetical protein H0X02_07165, partial [Nitrosomonas sp.]|nr:hypothetical protein [Nitrosomonas sp.]